MIYTCAYKHCLHKGEQISPSKAVKMGSKYYHWDCAAISQQITRIRDTYIERIDGDAQYPVLTKILNDLIFKYEQDPDYVEWSVNYWADIKHKVKSPFVLLYLRKNPYMQERWDKYKDRK